MTDTEDFANPIEPSSKGGQKMADTIVNVVRTHPFGSRRSVVYPQAYPTSVLVQTDETEETKTDNATNETKEKNSTQTTEKPSPVLDVILSIRPPTKYLPGEAVENAAAAGKDGGE